MSTEVSKNLTLDQRMIAIQNVADNTSIAKLHDLPQVTRAITLARGMRELRKLFDGEVLDTVCELMDSNLGFRTDRAPGSKDKAGNPLKPYGKETVRDCAIECLLRGGNMVGNEFNIISARCYLTKEYYERIVRELVNDLRIVEGVPQACQGGALVPITASWVFDGRPDSIACVKTEEADHRIPVRVNFGMGTDAIIGKAHRKLFAKIHRRVTGSTWLEETVNDTEVVTVNGDSQHNSEVVGITTDATAEDGAEAVTNETVEISPVFTGIQQLLSGLEGIREVNEYESQAALVLASDEEKVALTEWCDWRREQIRESRGQRAN